MSPEEFERLKEEEKRHLRELRALKQQYGEVRRKKSILNALTGMTRPDLAATHDEAVGKVMGEAALSEARMDLALEGQGPALTEADREAQRRAEADALVRQFKAEMGERPGEPGSRGGSADVPPAAGKTLGRVPPPEAGGAAAPDDDARGAKTLGRPRREG